MSRRVNDELNETITAMERTTRLRTWNDFVEAFDVPGDLFPALATNRAELLAFAPHRDMKAEEVDKLYRMIGILIETNLELRQHAEQVAHQVRIWTDAFKALRSVGARIEAFAEFRRTDEDDE